MSHDLTFIAVEGSVVINPTITHTGRGTPLCKFGIVSEPKRRVGGQRIKDNMYFTVSILGKTAETIYPMIKPGLPVRVEGEYLDGIYLNALTDKPCIGRVIFASRVKVFVYYRQRKVSQKAKERAEKSAAVAAEIGKHIDLDELPF